MALPKAAGVNRFAWNLRYPPPLSLSYGYNGELLAYTEYTTADHAIADRLRVCNLRDRSLCPGTTRSSCASPARHFGNR